MPLETTYVPLDDLEIRSEDDRHYIEGIAVPWGTRTDRVLVPELFERGAFADLVKSDRKVKLTDYNHSRERIPVGYSTAVEDRDAGLWMRFRLNRTPEGESAHANSLEGVYGGLSIGFIAKSDEMRGGVRHVKSARLDHVSLVEVPAYEDAVIMAMRSAVDSETADLRALIAKRYDPIDFSAHSAETLLESIVSRRAASE